MALAGAKVLAGQVPGELIGRTKNTADSATFTTTEAVVMTLTVSLIEGHTYWVWSNPGFGSTVDNDQVRARIREDDVSGTELDGTFVLIADALSTRKWSTVLANEFTATSTGDKTFVVTGERTAGSGNIVLEGDATRPSFLRVTYQEGP